MMAKLFTAIDMLAENGPLLREPYSKPLGDGIFELRVQSGSDILRVLYFFIVGRRAVLTNGFIKKTPKTPPAEIKLAKKYRAEFLSREDGAMTNFKDLLEEQLKDPEFRVEWDALQPERALVQAMIDARKTTGLTQQQLSERTGISQSDISKFETGGGNPSLKTLQRLAEGMGMVLHIEFRPAAGN